MTHKTEFFRIGRICFFRRNNPAEIWLLNEKNGVSVDFNAEIGEQDGFAEIGFDLNAENGDSA